jgi:predicted nucleic acid-binding protein
VAQALVLDLAGAGSAEGAPSFSRFLREGWDAKMFAQRNEQYSVSSIATRWPQSRDPNDEMVLEAAINGRADALVTYNVADFAGPAERFRISVLRPSALLRKMKP